MNSAFLLIPILLLAGCSSAPHNAGKDVPIGSSVAELDPHFRRIKDSRAQVKEWLPATTKVKGRPISNAFGKFIEVDRGDYDAWKTSAAAANFTGEITFFQRAFTSTADSFIYVNGRLRKKDWGFLPG